MNSNNTNNPALRITNFTKFANQILTEINYARANPGSYSRVLQGFIDKMIDNTIYINGFGTYISEGISVLEEAIEFLEDIKELNPLTVKEGLYESAEKLLNVLVLHDGMNMNDEQNQYEIEKRLKRYGTAFGIVDELIDYGSFDPVLIVIQFILCDGDEDRKDRATLFNEKLTCVGIASGLMPSDRVCTVIDFAEKFFNPDEQIDNYVINYYLEKTIDYVGAKRKNSAGLFLEKQEKFKKSNKEIQNFNLNKLLQKTPDEEFLPEDAEKVTLKEKKILDKNGNSKILVKKTIFYKDGRKDSIIFQK